LGITRSEDLQTALAELKDFWKQNAVKNKSFVNFETALLRWGKEWRRKRQH